jgi:hypothetical protein
MPAPKFLAGLPKPVLFGLYGAVAGLLGALAFGEPLWKLLKPPPAPEPEPQLAVAASPKVQVYRESSNTFAVKVARERFTGPVAIEFPKLPVGVLIPPVVVPPGEDEAKATVTAMPETAPGEYKATLKAEAETTGERVRATADFTLVVVQPPPPPPAIAIAVPPDLTVYKRGNGKFPLLLDRRNFDGPVTVSVEPLPAGVTFATKVVSPGEVEVTLTAAADAAVGSANLNVIVSADAPPLKLKETAATKLAVQAPPVAPVEIVFVLDVTKSMQWAIEDLKNGIGKFADTLSKNQLDFRLGLVTFQDITIPGEKVEVIKFKVGQKDEVFTSDVGVFRDKVGTLKADGGGDPPESSLEALAEAANMPFRQGASKILLLITDAPPKVADGTRPADAVAQRAATVKDKGIDSVHIVVTRFDQEVYKPLLTAGADKAGGKYFNLGDVVRGDEGFDGLLVTFSRSVTDAALAKTPAAKPVVAGDVRPPTLADVPAATPQAAAAPAAPSVQSVASSGKFAAGSEGQLTLATGVWTGAIAALVCPLLLAGQSHYLRGSLPGVGGIALGLLGGLVAGAVGGAAGQGLFMATSGNAALGTAFRVLGWALLGGLAGAGLSLFIPNMKWFLGLAGGAIGGAVGCAGFLAVESAAGELAGRLVGGLLLGFCIGLMVAVVEAAFRRAWLEVRFGARETITVNLGPEPVKVGGDAKACTVWARGAAPIALRFFVRDGQVICDDAAMKREIHVAEGFSKEVGNVTVTVHTGSGGVSGGLTPPGSPARPTPAAPAPRRTTVDDDFDLPMPVPTNRGLTPPARQEKPAPAPLSLDDDPLPLPPPPPPAPPARPAPAAPVPAKPVAPVPAAPVVAKPPAPASPPAPPKPVVPPKPVAPVAAKPAAPPKPAAPVAAKPAAPTVPPAAPKPAAPAGAKHPDACPSCGRVNAGKPKQRYCMVCDNTY